MPSQPSRSAVRAASSLPAAGDAPSEWPLVLGNGRELGVSTDGIPGGERAGGRGRGHRGDDEDEEEEEEEDDDDEEEDTDPAESEDDEDEDEGWDDGGVGVDDIFSVESRNGGGVGVGARGRAGNGVGGAERARKLFASSASASMPRLTQQKRPQQQEVRIFPTLPPLSLDFSGKRAGFVRLRLRDTGRVP